MHMSDALISPAVGGVMWTASAVTIAYCAKKLKEETTPQLPPLMGIMGAFVFAAQMINFSIIGTGSSGHLGGGLLLAAILGPYAGFITIASVLLVQALFFADGGLLSMGCNIFNLGFFPCFIAYPLIYKTLLGKQGIIPSAGRLLGASMLASIIGLQLGSLGVVLETLCSGITDLPMSKFLLAMQPIHFVIGIGEGLATAALLLFLRKARPSLLQNTLAPSSSELTLKGTFLSLAVLTVFIGGFLSWHASSKPDGLEWAIEKSSGKEELAPPDSPLYSKLGSISEKTAFLPDYNFANAEEESRYGTSLAGLAGGGATFILLFLVASLRGRKKENDFVS